MLDAKNIAYAFTIKGGGWQTLNCLCIITKDGSVMYSSHFYDDIKDITEFTAERTYKLEGDLDSYDLESFKDFQYMVMDAPTYTMYKFKDGVAIELFSDTHEECCSDMQRIARLCFSGGAVKC